MVKAALKIFVSFAVCIACTVAGFILDLLTTGSAGAFTYIGFLAAFLFYRSDGHESSRRVDVFERVAS